MSVHSALTPREREADRNSSASTKDGTRTPEKHKCPGQTTGACSVEVLAHYERLNDILDLREQAESESGTPCNIPD